MAPAALTPAPAATWVAGAVLPAGAALLDRVEADMTERIDRLCARSPDGAQLLESLTWLGAAIDQLQAELTPTGTGTGTASTGATNTTGATAPTPGTSPP